MSRVYLFIADTLIRRKEKASQFFHLCIRLTWGSNFYCVQITIRSHLNRNNSYSQQPNNHSKSPEELRQHVVAAGVGVEDSAGLYRAA